jgi:hypothetical protein
VKSKLPRRPQSSPIARGDSACQNSGADGRSPVAARGQRSLGGSACECTTATRPALCSAGKNTSSCYGDVRGGGRYLGGSRPQTPVLCSELSFVSPAGHWPLHRAALRFVSRQDQPHSHLQVEKWRTKANFTNQQPRTAHGTKLIKRKELARAIRCRPSLAGLKARRAYRIRSLAAASCCADAALACSLQKPHSLFAG